MLMCHTATGRGEDTRAGAGGASNQRQEGRASSGKGSGGRVWNTH